MTTPNDLEALAAGMYANRKSARLTPYLVRSVGRVKLVPSWRPVSRKRIIVLTDSLIVTVCFQTIATLQFVEWCARSWSRERRVIRVLAVSAKPTPLRPPSMAKDADLDDMLRDRSCCYVRIVCGSCLWPSQQNANTLCLSPPDLTNAQ